MYSLQIKRITCQTLYKRNNVLQHVDLREAITAEKFSHLGCIAVVVEHAEKPRLFVIGPSVCSKSKVLKHQDYPDALKLSGFVLFAPISTNLS